MNADQLLECHRLLCPMPVIKTQNRIKEMHSGETLQVIATDPGTREDIPAWCRINGHEVLEINEAGREIHFLIRIGDG